MSRIFLDFFKRYTFVTIVIFFLVFGFAIFFLKINYEKDLYSTMLERYSYLLEYVDLQNTSIKNSYIRQLQDIFTKRIKISPALNSPFTKTRLSREYLS